MQIDDSKIGDASILSLTGDLDSFSSSYLRERINRLFDEGIDRVVVDLTKVAFVDSAGLGQLVAALKMCFHKGGDLVLVGINESVQDLLRITKLDTVFRVYETVEEAANALSK